MRETQFTVVGGDGKRKAEACGARRTGDWVESSCNIFAEVHKMLDFGTLLAPECSSEVIERERVA